MTREPLLVQDVTDGAMHPLLRDEYLTTGSFISFPLVYHGELLGVVNLTNRAKRGVFIEEDVERVRLLGPRDLAHRDTGPARGPAAHGDRCRLTPCKPPCAAWRSANHSQRRNRLTPSD
jgi:hypothetical protein